MSSLMSAGFWQELVPPQIAKNQFIQLDVFCWSSTADYVYIVRPRKITLDQQTVLRIVISVSQVRERGARRVSRAQKREADEYLPPRRSDGGIDESEYVQAQDGLWWSGAYRAHPARAQTGDPGQGVPGWPPGSDQGPQAV